MSRELVRSPLNPDWLIPKGWEQILGLQIDYRLGSSVLHLWRVQFNQHLDAAHSSAPHAHSTHQLLYYQRGHGILEVDGQRYEITRGAVFFVPAQRVHRFESDREEAATCLAMDFTVDHSRTPAPGALPMEWEAAILLSLLYAQPARPFPLSAADQVAIDRCIADVVEESERRETGFASLIQANLLRLTALCIRGTERARGFGEHFRHTAWRHRLIADRARTLILERATEQPELTLSEAARVCGASMNQLNRILRRETGATFHQALLHRRLELARELLREGRWNCTEAALRSGFNDSNYFSRAFRKRYGFAPSELLPRGPDGAERVKEAATSMKTV